MAGDVINERQFKSTRTSKSGEELDCVSETLVVGKIKYVLPNDPLEGTAESRNGDQVWFFVASKDAKKVDAILGGARPFTVGFQREGSLAVSGPGYLTNQSGDRYPR